MTSTLKTIKKIELAFVALLISFLFYLQFRHLHLAASPGTDEGVYAEAGRLMMEGLIPHRDFPIWHLPVLPLFIGLTLKLTGNMYFVRVLFLLLNCVAIVPLYLAFKEIRNNIGAALIAILFYMTFHEMVDHDFRFVAIRQLANDFFIWFFYLGVCHKQWKWTPIIQSVLSTLSVLLFLPTVFNLLFISLALSFSEKTRRQQRHQLKRYFLSGIPPVLGLILYFSLIPEGIEQAVFGQIDRAATSRLDRLKIILASKDIYFYLISCIGLLSASIFHRLLSAYALAMIGVVLVSIFLSSSFYPHYPSVAGPAFAFGIFALGVLVNEHFKEKSSYKLIVFAIYMILVFFQLLIVFPSLNSEWKNNQDYDYYRIVKVLSQSPDPLLAMEPIFAVEANKKMIRSPIEVYFRSPNPTKKFTKEEYEDMAAKACTILLEESAKEFFPVHLQQQWLQEFEIVEKNRLGLVLITNHQQCK